MLKKLWIALSVFRTTGPRAVNILEIAHVLQTKLGFVDKTIEVINKH